jgi:hypothetical protein
MGKKIFKAVTKVMSSKVMDPLQINKGTGILTPVESALAGETSPLDGLTGAATTRAAEMQAQHNADIARQQQILQQNAAMLQGQAVSQNQANVVAGGSAAAADVGDVLGRRRNRQGPLSATIGI